MKDNKIIAVFAVVVIIVLAVVLKSVFFGGLNLNFKSHKAPDETSTQSETVSETTEPPATSPESTDAPTESDLSESAAEIPSSQVSAAGQTEIPTTAKTAPETTENAQTSAPAPSTTLKAEKTTVPAAATTSTTNAVVPATTAVKTTKATTVKSEKTTAGDTSNTYAYAYAGFTPVLADTSVKWNMLLVNRDFILPEDFTVTLSEAVKGSGVNLDARVSPHYQKMYDAALKDGIKLTPLSGHRRISTQKKNFENKISLYMNQGYSKAQATQLAAQIILPPGTSEHNAGLAMDIISLDKSFENTKEFKWLDEHADEYGFILRYPEDKTDITKITYEPWHWRYVGVAAAKEIKKSGLCLEEYLGVA
ncbi:MAG: D-alanyl-D-alanine carboxypeptidase family protein [Clostridiales bacterium]|nr:D-alanyl-D-alanine carboxypeptidase family protein [Clostridiales bacterium]